MSEHEQENGHEKPDIRIVYRDEDGREADLSGLVGFLVSYFRPFVWFCAGAGTKTT